MTRSASGARRPDERMVAAARAAVGIALLGDPALGVARSRTASLSREEAVASRLLGARMIAQAILTAALPTPRVVRFGVAIDAAHGLSMAALASASSTHRRLAATNGAIAAAFVAAGLTLHER